MPIFSLLALVLSLGLSALADEPSVFETKKQPNVQQIYVPYDDLSDRQKELLGTLQKARGFQGSGVEFWNALGKDTVIDGKPEDGNSVQRTFFYTTEAMERRFAKDGKTKVSDLIDSITEVRGSVTDDPSNEQFNIAVKWKTPPVGTNTMKDEFENAKKWYDRPSIYHPGETGVQETKDGYSGLHLLFADDNSGSGHVTVSFRKTGIFEAVLTALHLSFLVPSFLKHGHFSPEDSDIGALGPEKQHGKPIDNLKIFAKTYKDPRVLAFSQFAPLGERAWTDAELIPEVNPTLDKNLPAASGVNAEVQTPTAAGQAI